MFAQADLDYALPGGARGSDEAEVLWADLMYEVGGGDGWQPFVLFGGGRTNYNFDSAAPEL